MLDLNFLEHLIEAISAKAKVLYLITAWGDEPIFLNFSIARITGGGATGKTICWYMEDIPFIHLSPSRPRLIRCHFDCLNISYALVNIFHPRVRGLTVVRCGATTDGGITP